MEYLNIKLISDLSRLSIEINKELQNDYYKTIFPPELITMIWISSIHNKYPIFLLSKTLLRYGDLINLKVKEAAENGYFEIIQGKTKTFIKREFPIFNFNLKKMLLSTIATEYNFNYNSIATEIKHLKKDYFNVSGSNYKSNTHIFRHIRTSSDADSGISREALSFNLGHVHNNSINSYLHDSILNNHLQTN